MKRFRTVLFVLLLLLSATFVFASEKIEVLFTHDIHSHLEPFKYGMDENGDPNEVGGLGRISTIVKSEREANPNLLFLDAGDFSMGTLYQTVFETNATELKALSMLGVDATTFGNHEFDLGDDAIVNMYNTLKKDRKGEYIVPLIAQSNADYSESVISSLNLPSYMVFNKNDIRIAVFALMGKDSVLFTPKTDVEFSDIEIAAKNMVDYLKKNEHPDMIVALSHTGTSTELKDSEDENLAINVDGIDLIISGHTHTVLETPLVHNNTTIVSAGSYGVNLGKVVLEKDADSSFWHYSEYKLFPIDENTQSDAEFDSELLSYSESINDEYLSSFGVKASDVVMYTPETFMNEHDVWDYKNKETNLGNFLSDALLYMYNTDPSTKEKATVGVVPAGLVRDTFHKGDVTVKDVFTVNSLGIGPDGKTGYPICEFYLTGKELKYAAEVAVSVSPFMGAANLQFSGLRFSANSKRLIMNKVYSVEVFENGEWQKVENKRLYKAVTDLYSLEMISTVTKLTKGIISFVPKDENGNPIQDINDTVVYLENRNEMKGWVAPIKYAETFRKDNRGIPVVDEAKLKVDGRRHYISTLSPVNLFRSWNKITVIILSVILLIILIIALIVWLICRTIKKRKVKKITSKGK